MPKGPAARTIESKFADQHGSQRQLREDDVAVAPDWSEIDRLCFGTTQETEFAHRYIGDVINLNDRQRLILAGRLFLSPKMPVRRIAVAMNLHPREVRRYLSESLRRLEMTSPRLELARSELPVK